MVKMTIVGRVSDGLPIAQSPRYVNEEDENFSSYKQQAGFILKEISRTGSSLAPSKMTIRLDLHQHCFNTGTSQVTNVVVEKDLEHLLRLIETKGGKMEWQSMMGHSTSNLTYKAWRLDLEDESVLIWFSGKEEKHLKLSHMSKIISGQRGGIDIKEMLAGASLMDEANRTTVMAIYFCHTIECQLDSGSGGNS